MKALLSWFIPEVTIVCGALKFRILSYLWLVAANWVDVISYEWKRNNTCPSSLLMRRLLLAVRQWRRAENYFMRGSFDFDNPWRKIFCISPYKYVLVIGIVTSPPCINCSKLVNKNFLEPSLMIHDKHFFFVRE